MIDVVADVVALGLGRVCGWLWADGIDIVGLLEQVAMPVKICVCFTRDLFGGKIFYLFAKQFPDPWGQ